MFVLLVSVAGHVFAQGSGSISGTVKDNSGALVAGATVTLANPSVGVAQTVTTNSVGTFTSPEIPPGTYTVTVEQAGFKKSEKTNVVLSVASKVNIGVVVLQIGNVSETLVVEADPGQLQIQTESGERSDIVTNRQLRDIALNGRNAVDFLKIVPGVLTTKTYSQSSVQNITDGYNINGTRSIQHEYTIDGVTNLNLGNNSGGIVSVNPDALEEIKVLTSNYQAEYGRAGGGYIALTTRGGTSEYHGGLGYFRRHDSMNANSYFNNAKGGSAAGSPRPLYRYNQYDWNFGGPVPGVGTKDERKLFFFMAQEYDQQLVPLGTVNIRVPTALERLGDFSQSVDGTGKPINVIDPLTGKQFPGNNIPANRFYTYGQAILNLMPLPNTTAGGNQYNYTSQVSSNYPRREDIARVDWQLADSTRVSARFIHNFDNQQWPYGTTTATWNWPLTVVNRNNGPGYTWALSVTHNFSSTLINEFTYAAARGGTLISPSDDKATRSATGINTPMLFPSANTSNLIPSLTFGGIASITTNATNPATNQTAGTSVFGTFDQKFVINNFGDALTKVAGSHTFKIGVFYQRASNSSNSQTHVESDIDFTSTGSNPFNTGYPFANALLGVYTSYLQASNKPQQSYFYYDLSGYVQDTWKVTPRLTLDLGVRVSHYEPYYNSTGDGAYFDPTLFNAANAPRLYRGVCVGTPCSGANLRAADPGSPGSATQPSFYIGKIVPNSGNLSNGMGLTANGYPRGGIDGQPILPQPRLGFSWDMTGNHKTVLRGGFGMTYDRYTTSDGSAAAGNPPLVLTPSLSNGYLQDIAPGGGGVLGPATALGLDRAAKWPLVYSYSVGIQRDLGKGIIIDVAYVGSQSRNNPREVNLNAVPVGAAFLAKNQDPTKFAGGVVPAVEANLPLIYSSAGVNFSGANALGTDFMRPYQGYGDINYFMFDGKTTYNSLQVQVQRRFTKGLTVGLNYMYSRAITTVSTDGIYTSNIDPEKYDRGLANWNRTHYFTANYVWNLPKVGGFWLTRALFDNWTLSGISQAVSGNPAELGLTISGVDAGTRLLGTPTGTTQLGGNAPRLLVTGQAQSAPNAINLAAFGVPGVGNTGPYSRYYLLNPGFVNHDVTLAKNIPFGGSGRRYLQLRVEAFNVFNHTEFSGVNRTTNLTNAAGKTGAAILTDFTGLTVTNNLRPAGSTQPLGNYFGEYNAANSPRIIQLAAKLYF